MQRDFELIRDLLIYFDQKEGPDYVELPEVGDKYSDFQIKYHLVLLYQAGLLTCEPVRSSTSDRIAYVIPFDLTWEGHDFLAKIRNDAVWERMRAITGPGGFAPAFDVMQGLATKLAFEGAGL